MKNKLFFVFGLFWFVSISSQEKLALDNFVSSLCGCIDKTSGTRDEVLKICMIELSKKDSKLIQTAKKIADKEGNIDKQYWHKVNLLLAENCDSYNLIIIENFVDKNHSFSTIVKSIGDDICQDIISLEVLNDKNIKSVFIPYLKKNQEKLLKIYSSPKEVVKNINNYLALNCKRFRTHFSTTTAKKEY